MYYNNSTCTIAIVHACIIAVIHACKLAIAHACSVAIIHASFKDGHKKFKKKVLES